MARPADHHRRFTQVLTFGVVLALGLATGCDDDRTCSVRCEAPPSIAMEFGGLNFFDSPFPSDTRRLPDGRPDLGTLPNPANIGLVAAVQTQLQQDAKGFGLTSAVFFRANVALDEQSLPNLHETVTSAASVQLIDVSPESPFYLRRYPIRVRFSPDPGPYGPPNQLAAIPLQGVPLRGATRYAAIVTRGVRDSGGRPLKPSDGMQALLDGRTPAGFPPEQLASHSAALDAILEASVQRSDVVAMTVFTTDDPARELLSLVAAARAEFTPAFSVAPAPLEEHADYCVYEAAVSMPVFQAGQPPFSASGGGFAYDASGNPALQRRETARVFFTIPRQPMPSAGYPFVVMSRTGGGGDRPLIDRGVRAENGGPPIAVGTGPALEFARVGYAGVSADGPHGGPRNISGGDEQLLVYNFQNPLALRDNIRQSAIELALLPDLLLTATIDISACAGASAPGSLARFDLNHAALMGHSMGASIAPLTAAVEPRYRALLLSGAGGSFLENLIHKQKPLAVKPLAELVLGLTVAGYELQEDSLMASILQWAGEPADSPLYGHALAREPWEGLPRHVLMMQGIVDHYIMPPIANAASLSFNLDLAGPSLDAVHPELNGLDSLESLLPLVGRATTTLPATGNTTSSLGRTTAIVTQWPEDGIEDGHEVMFQTAGPKRAYRCFLESLLTESEPTVIAEGATLSCATP